MTVIKIGISTYYISSNGTNGGGVSLLYSLLLETPPDEGILLEDGTTLDFE